MHPSKIRSPHEQIGKKNGCNNGGSRGKEEEEVRKTRGTALLFTAGSWIALAVKMIMTAGSGYEPAVKTLLIFTPG